MQAVERGGAGVGARDPLARGLGRGQVRIDRLLPHAEAGEDVRRHVQRVRRGRRDLGVAARRRQRQIRQRRVVEGVDHVVRDPRVLGLERKQAIQDLRRPLLPRVGLVGRRVVGHAEDRQGVEDRRLMVVGDALRHAGHRLLVGHHARWVGHAVSLVVGVDRGDVVALSRARRAESGRLLSRRLPSGEFAFRRRPPNRVEIAHRDPPVRHGAAGVLRRHVLEGLRRLGVGERVQQRQAPRESRLNPGLARDREVNPAELLWRGVSVVVLVLRDRPRRNQGEGGRQDDGAMGGSHRCLLGLEHDLVAYSGSDPDLPGIYWERTRPQSSDVTTSELWGPQSHFGALSAPDPLLDRRAASMPCRFVSAGSSPTRKASARAASSRQRSWRTALTPSTCPCLPSPRRPIPPVACP